ncbi:MAG: hypothetical protein ACYS7Y_26485, partial [Planctomycetota bacterium]
MKSALSPVKCDGTRSIWFVFVLVLPFLVMAAVCESKTPEAEEVLGDMDHASNWLKKVYDHTGKMPRYGCLTYDFHDDPFPDAAWNRGVEKMWDRGLIVGVFTFYANPAGRAWNDPVDI